MGRSEESDPRLPPRIRAAFDFLDHARAVTDQFDASIPARSLSSLEKSVETAALRVLQQYLLGEMDFAESSATSSASSDDDCDSNDEQAPLTK